MRALLVLGGPRLAKGPILEAVARASAAGWRVDVVTWRALDQELREAVHGTGGQIVLPGALPGRVPAGAAEGRAGLASTGSTSNTGPWLVRAARWRWRRARRALKDRLPTSGRAGAVATKLCRRLPPSIGFSRLALRDVDAVRLLRTCDVAVAVDRDAALTVWRLARRRPDVTAVSGAATLAGYL